MLFLSYSRKIVETNAIGEYNFTALFAEFAYSLTFALRFLVSEFTYSRLTNMDT